MPPVRIVSGSERETRAIAAGFAEIVRAAPQPRSAFVIALEGELGSGKTTFVRGFLRGFGGRKLRVPSPTFLIMRKFALAGRSLWHIDCYRVGSRDLRQLGIAEMMERPGNILLIEWADRIKTLLPRNTIWIHFAHGKNAHERFITTRRYHPPAI